MEKSRITIRLDDRNIDWFKTQVEEAGGGNYQFLDKCGVGVKHMGAWMSHLKRL